MKLSIVTTLYRSAAAIADFIERSCVAASAITDDFEIVIVDDGSPDDSLSIAIGIGQTNPHLKIIELSRNFGHHKALMTGLMHAAGEYCFLIDSDLEEDPALLAKFWREIHEKDQDVIYGYQIERSGDVFRRLSGAVAYSILDLVIPYKVPRNHLTVRLMRRAYVNALIQHRESEIIIGNLWVITGFRQAGLPVAKPYKGHSSYSTWRRWTLLLDAIASISEVPLVAIFYVGMMISAGSGLVSFWLLLRWTVNGVGVPGWVSVMLSVWLLGGIAILFIGIIGIYLSKIFIETKNRPYTIIRNVYQHTALASELPAKPKAPNEPQDTQPI